MRCFHIFLYIPPADDYDSPLPSSSARAAVLSSLVKSSARNKADYKDGDTEDAEDEEIDEEDELLDIVVDIRGAGVGYSEGELQAVSHKIMLIHTKDKDLRVE